jgi:hypothetical protein
MARICHQAAEIAKAAYDGSPAHGDHFLVSGPFIGIRGSDDVSDWWSNLHIRRTGQFHSGFLRGAHNIAARLPAFAPGTIFTGHSRGGAIALILGQLYNCPVITFGAPKTGVDYPHIAFVAAGDPVPTLPLSYRRKHTVLYLSGKGVIKNPSRTRVLWDILVRRGINHRMNNYKDLLDATDAHALAQAAYGQITAWATRFPSTPTFSRH